MRRYTNQQLTSAEVIAELIELAKEVAAEAAAAQQFTPRWTTTSWPSTMRLRPTSLPSSAGRGRARRHRPELVAVMRRDIRTDWTVRDDVRAKLRSSIKRLLVKYKYPPDKQPGAITLVIEQMESMAPRYASGGRRAVADAPSRPNAGPALHARG